MPYTRRALLRDAALLSASVPLFGCKPKALLATPLAPLDGVNIFFEGCWLFCSSNQNGGSAGTSMYAIARDMNYTGSPCPIPHIFPFGPWSSSVFDTTMPSLDLNPEDQQSQALIPYSVTVTGYDATTVPQGGVFQDALNNRRGPFRCLKGTKSVSGADQNLMIDLGLPGLRVIQLPIPSAIYPAGFALGSLNDGASVLAPSTCKAAKCDAGVATSHIFHYKNATAATLDAEFTVKTPTHLHFHSVPQDAATLGHGADMFQNLLGIIYYLDATGKKQYLSSADLAYTAPPADQCPVVGVDATGFGISSAELDLPYECGRTGQLASCSAGGIGLGGGGGS